MKVPTVSPVKSTSPHYITYDLSVNFLTFAYYSYKVSLVTSEASVSSIQLTEKRSPKQLPICFPFTTSSSGGQYVPQLLSSGEAALTA